MASSPASSTRPACGTTRAARRPSKPLMGVETTGQLGGLLGRWDLNEGSGSTAADSSGHGITGTLTSGPVWVIGFPTVATFILDGTVSGTSGPLANVPVHVFAASGGTYLTSVLTNGSGDYAFTLPAGSYKLLDPGPGLSRPVARRGDLRGRHCDHPGPNQTVERHPGRRPSSSTAPCPAPAGPSRRPRCTSSPPPVATYLTSVLTNGSGDYAFTLPAGSYKLLDPGPGLSRPVARRGDLRGRHCDHPRAHQTVNVTLAASLRPRRHRVRHRRAPRGRPRARLCRHRWHVPHERPHQRQRRLRLHPPRGQLQALGSRPRAIPTSGTTRRPTRAPL